MIHQRNPSFQWLLLEIFSSNIGHLRADFSIVMFRSSWSLVYYQQTHLLHSSKLLKCDVIKSLGSCLCLLYVAQLGGLSFRCCRLHHNNHKVAIMPKSNPLTTPTHHSATFTKTWNIATSVAITLTIYRPIGDICSVSLFIIWHCRSGVEVPPVGSLSAHCIRNYRNDDDTFGNTWGIIVQRKKREHRTRNPAILQMAILLMETLMYGTNRNIL